MPRSEQLSTFYRPEQSITNNAPDSSRSPEKPKLLLEKISEIGYDQYLLSHQDFPPLNREDFLIAHEEKYVDAFFSGEGRLARSNMLKWSKEFTDSVAYTNSSLYHSIKYSLENPSVVTFSPTSGFHHARPQMGSMFCTFSGQVIASVKLYRESGVSGAYVDLDAHFGNSIEDTREFCPDLNNAVLPGMNINLEGKHEQYINNLRERLDFLSSQVISGDVDYVVFCHGADSHVDDDLGGQCTTSEWLECSHIFYNWVKETDKALGRPLPLSLSLFGGYRDDDFNSVLSLHIADLVSCLNILCGREIEYFPQVTPKPPKLDFYDNL